MTRVDISPEQLDAMAAAPVRDLDHLIYWHRLLFADDKRVIRLHDHSGEDPGDGSPEPPADPLGYTGMPFSARFRRFLNGDYGQVYPWMNGYRWMRDRCRSTHTRGHTMCPKCGSHTEEDPCPWDGSLCGALVSFVVRRDYIFDRAVYDLYLTRDRAERVLRSAFAGIEQRMDALQSRQRGVSYGGMWPREPAREQRHDQPGLHQIECEQCRRRGVA